MTQVASDSLQIVLGPQATAVSGSSMQQPAHSAQPMKLRSEHESFA